MHVDHAGCTELHKSGVLSDYEFAVAKQKLLDERWEGGKQ